MAAFNQSGDPPLNITIQSAYGQHGYDATWALARALNLTAQGI